MYTEKLKQKNNSDNKEKQPKQPKKEVRKIRKRKLLKRYLDGEEEDL